METTTRWGWLTTNSNIKTRFISSFLTYLLAAPSPEFEDKSWQTCWGCIISRVFVNSFRVSAIPNDYTNSILFPGFGFHTSELKLTSAGKREVSGDQGGFWFPWIQRFLPPELTIGLEIHDRSSPWISAACSLLPERQRKIPQRAKLKQLEATLCILKTIYIEPFGKQLKPLS